jgi:acyl carrier protein
MSTMLTRTEAEIRDFISTRYPDQKISDDDDIFSLGFVNSLFAMELVVFLEKTFDITIPNEDLQIDHFRTVNRMCALVERQTKVVAPGHGRSQ